MIKQMISRIGWNVLIGAMLIVGVAWIWAGRIPPGTGEAESNALPPAPAIGHPAPDFTLGTVVGEPFALSGLRGRPVVLNFWATWCPPCRSELPVLEAAHKRYAGQLVVAGVNQAEEPDSVQRFADQFGLSFPIPLDEGSEVSRQYGVRSLPTTFFIDRAGVTRHIQTGPLTEATMAQALKAIYP